MPSIKHGLEEFISGVESKKGEAFHVVYGLKAAPLTLAHEEIIRGCVSDFVEKYGNVHLRIEIADSKWKGMFDIVGMVRDFASRRLPSNESLQEKFGTAALSDWFNDRIRVESQDCWNGMYRWLKANGFDGKHTLLVLGGDELDGLTSDNSTWEDADLVLDEYHVYCAKARTDGISSTMARELLYKDPDIAFPYVRHLISKGVYDWIKDNGAFWQLKRNYRAEENNFIRNYNPGRYERPSVTVDNLVWYEDGGMGYVLLIRRGGHPYKSFWALPGGFFDVNDDPDLKSAAMRELKEETGLGGGESRDEMHPVQFRAYSDIGTDPRTRVVDVVYATKVTPDIAIKCSAADDAEDVGWFPLNDLPRLAFNHGQIVNEYFQSIGLAIPE